MGPMNDEAYQGLDKTVPPAEESLIRDDPTWMPGMLRMGELRNPDLGMSPALREAEKRLLDWYVETYGPITELEACVNGPTRNEENNGQEAAYHV